MVNRIHAFFFLIVFVTLHFRDCTVTAKTVKPKVSTNGTGLGIGIDHFNERNEYTGENYFQKKDSYDNEETTGELTEEEKRDLLYQFDLLDPSSIKTSPLIDTDYAEQIKKLKNKNVLEKLQKTYYAKGMENEEVINQIKKIVSETLHIPFNKIHLHNLNTIMRKWRSINKEKTNLEEESTNDSYLKEIREHGEETKNDSEDLEKDELVEIPSGKLQKDSFVAVDYLLELAS